MINIHNSLYYEYIGLHTYVRFVSYFCAYIDAKYRTLRELSLLSMEN